MIPVWESSSNWTYFFKNEGKKWGPEYIQYEKILLLIFKYTVVRIVKERHHYLNEYITKA